MSIFYNKNANCIKTRRHVFCSKYFKNAVEYDVQIWSSDAEQTHSPPSNLVMKEQTWHLADDMKTTLLDSKGEVLILTLLSSLGFFCVLLGSSYL